MASTGVASTLMTLVAYSDQKNTGMRYQVMPGARSRWMVTMKFRPVAIEREAGDEDADGGQHDVALGVVGGERRVEGPAGVEPAAEQRPQRDQRRRP